MTCKAHVKHFLNESGKKYFSLWIVEAKSALKKQNGFLNISYAFDPADKSCINIWIDFSDLQALEKWSSTELHGKIVSKLDVYRTKPFVSVKYKMEEI